jgi:hypothetical protein
MNLHNQIAGEVVVAGASDNAENYRHCDELREYCTSFVHQ